MKENSSRTQILLIVLSVLLVGVLLVQCLFWAGIIGSSSGKSAGGSTETADSSEIAGSTETSGSTEAEAGTETAGNSETASSAETAGGSGTGDNLDGSGSLSREGYTLKQVVVLSRHNIRSPMSGGDSMLGKITPHEWFNWSSNPS